MGEGMRCEWVAGWIGGIVREGIYRLQKTRYNTTVPKTEKDSWTVMTCSNSWRSK